MDATAELGSNLVIRKHKVQPEHGDEQADAGRDYRNRLARLNSQVQTGTEKYSFLSFQLTTTKIGNLTRLIDTLATFVTVHTYIQVLHCMQFKYIYV